MRLFTIPHVALIATYRCTLKCKMCGSYIPYYHDPKDFDVETIIKSIDMLFQVADYIEVFNISGGEPLLHKEIARIIEYVLRYSNKIGKIELITNGTIVPSAYVFKLLQSRENMTVLVDDYGKSLSKKVPLIQEQLDNYNVNYRIRNYTGENDWCGGWVDFGDHTRKWDSLEKVERLFSKCTYSGEKSFCFSLVDGMIFPCSKAKRLFELGIAGQNVNEYINLVGELVSVESIKERFSYYIYHAKSLTACFYCNGFCEDSERVVPAEQMITGVAYELR